MYWEVKLPPVKLLRTLIGLAVVWKGFRHWCRCCSDLKIRAFLQKWLWGVCQGISPCLITWKLCLHKSVSAKVLDRCRGTLGAGSWLVGGYCILGTSTELRIANCKLNAMNGRNVALLLSYRWGLCPLGTGAAAGALWCHRSSPACSPSASCPLPSDAGWRRSRPPALPSLENTYYVFTCVIDYVSCATDFSKQREPMFPK